MENHVGYVDVDRGASSLPGEVDSDASRHADHRRSAMVTALATTTAVCGAIALAFVGSLLSIVGRRRRMFRRRAVSRCTLRRLANCDVPPAPPWSRRPMHAEWVHD